jgi:hypothetical protein
MPNARRRPLLSVCVFFTSLIVGRSAAAQSSVPASQRPILDGMTRQIPALAMRAPSAAPQQVDFAWTRVQTVPRGRSLDIAIRGEMSQTVKFQTADDTTLTVLEGPGALRTIRKADIVEIRYGETFYARRGMLIGLAVGVAYGTAACWGENLVGVCSMFGGGIAMGLGAGIGGGFNAFAHEHEVIYRAPASESSVSQPGCWLARCTPARIKAMADAAPPHPRIFTFLPSSTVLALRKFAISSRARLDLPIEASSRLS